MYAQRRADNAGPNETGVTVPERVAVRAIGWKGRATIARLEDGTVLPVLQLDFVGVDGSTVVASIDWIAEPDQLRDARTRIGGLIDDALTAARRARTRKATRR